MQAESPKKELESVRSEMDSLNADLQADKQSRASLATQLAEQNKKIDQLDRDIHQTQDAIAKQNQHIAGLEQKMGKQTEAQQAQLDALYQQLRAAYRHAQPSYLKILLNQHDPALISRHHQYYRYFHQARQTQLSQIEHQLASLSQEQKTVFAAQKDLFALQENQAQQQALLEAQREQRQQTLAKLDNQISDKSSRLNALQQQEKALQSLLEKLRKQPPPAPKKAPEKPIPSFSGQSGSLLWPADGKLLARYGASRNIGKLRWKGIMISAESGSQVQASAAGRIVFADWMQGYGLLIIVDHGQQFMTLYGHNDSLLKSTGETVNAGEPIALSGQQRERQMTGVYFEVRQKGQPTDPLKWLQKQR
ncbi:Periplasmic septal ring factor with murein hydrolase activity EnvC/YibP [Methylophaga frappieri]|uniref:Periplasmic septal ring factor with murein hydrolase activity EnvC/YibP n=1 Tax=Methylophaga frappieri (strain ATCC BAA-2434 / DSM 25690 / JAM7) TaxID=754477 RepID=I1YJQ4_METFJ|nr:Periplasmic septal ring factor with murein hydrolase activity EnvC/YibP [Methylophaga frappieri]